MRTTGLCDGLQMPCTRLLSHRHLHKDNSQTSRPIKTLWESFRQAVISVEEFEVFCSFLHKYWKKKKRHLWDDIKLKGLISSKYAGINSFISSSASSSSCFSSQFLPAIASPTMLWHGEKLWHKLFSFLFKRSVFCDPFYGMTNDWAPLKSSVSVPLYLFIYSFKSI